MGNTTAMAGARLVGGRYRLVEPWGYGGMSVVWSGFDEVLQRPVAVKVLAGELASDPGLRVAIRREAQAAARLCHPHIANVYDYGESTLDSGEPAPFVVMELVIGEPLSTLLSGGARLPWRQAAGICAQVASALSEAHAHGVVHRDVKPGNVMIGRSGAKVVDFGISALVGECDLAEDGQLLGTPAYVAPERLDGGRAETASDVYAVGVLLHRALTGRLPWRVETAQELLAAHRAAEPPDLSRLDELTEVPAEVLRACRDCLSREPERRPSSADLARALGDESGVAVQFPSPVGSRGVGANGPATAWLGMGLATAWLSMEELTPLPRSWSIPGSWRVPSWLARSTTGRSVALASLAVLVLGAAAAFGGTGEPPPGVSTLRNPIEPPEAIGASSTDCRVRYQVERDWRTGFAAVVTVTNAGHTNMTGATLRFRFPGEQAIVGDGRWRQDGPDVAANLALPTGTSVRLPFTANYREENPLPLSFLVDGVTCDAVVTGLRASADDGGSSSDSDAGSDGGSGRGSGSSDSGSGEGSGHGKKKGKRDKDDRNMV